MRIFGVNNRVKKLEIARGGHYALYCSLEAVDGLPAGFAKDIDYGKTRSVIPEYFLRHGEPVCHASVKQRFRIALDRRGNIGCVDTPNV